MQASKKLIDVVIEALTPFSLRFALASNPEGHEVRILKTCRSRWRPYRCPTRNRVVPWWRAAGGFPNYHF
jgi:hypothetical protein